MTKQTAERERLAVSFPAGEGWKKWGPYLSERQWGTVREDYSAHGTAGSTFRTITLAAAPIAGARTVSPACRIPSSACASGSRCGTPGSHPQGAAVRPDQRRGQSRRGREGTLLLPRRHADAFVSQMLYKYPQAEYPYARLVEENRRRGIGQPEFELIDTGVFDDNRYFDVLVEYAQAAPDDILMRVTVENRGPQVATIHLLPQLWFRNTWSWKNGVSKPQLRICGPRTIEARHAALGTYYLHADGEPQDLLFCDNESNPVRCGTTPHATATGRTPFTSGS